MYNKTSKLLKQVLNINNNFLHILRFSLFEIYSILYFITLNFELMSCMYIYFVTAKIIFFFCFLIFQILPEPIYHLNLL